MGRAETVGELRVKVVCQRFPGLRFEDHHDAERPVKEPVWLALQEGESFVQQVPGNRRQATITLPLELCRRDDGEPDFRGSCARGKPGERFFYLAWGVKGSDGAFDMFRRVKVRLGHLGWPECEKAARTGGPLQVTLYMTDRHGGPICATPGPDCVHWGGS